MTNLKQLQNRRKKLLEELLDIDAALDNPMSRSDRKRLEDKMISEIKKLQSQIGPIKINITIESDGVCLILNDDVVLTHDIPATQDVHIAINSHTKQCDTNKLYETISNLLDGCVLVDISDRYFETIRGKFYTKFGPQLEQIRKLPRDERYALLDNITAGLRKE